MENLMRFFVLFVLGIIGIRYQSTIAQESASRQNRRPVRHPTSDDRVLIGLGTDRYQTRGSVQSFAFSPDSKWIAASESNSPTRNVRVFEVETGRQVFALPDPDQKAGWVTSISYSPDGTMLLCGELQGHITLWDIESRTPAWRGKSYAGDVESIGYSPDGQYFVAAGTGGNISIYVLKDGMPTGRVKVIGRNRGGVDGRVDMYSGSASMCFTPDSQKLIVAGSKSGGVVNIIDLKTGSIDRSISLNTEEYSNPGVNFVGLTNDGASILTAGQTTVPRTQTSIQFGPTNVTLTQLKVWDLKTGRHVRDLHTKDEYGFGRASLSPDSATLFVADFSMLTCRSVSEETVYWQKSLPGYWGGGANPVFSPDAKYVAIGLRNGLALFDAESGDQIFPRSNRGSGVVDASWSESGRVIVSGHRDGFVRIWDADSGELQWERELSPVVSPSGWNASPYFVAISPDEKTVIAGGRRDDPLNYHTGVIVGWDRESKREIFRSSFLADVRGGALSHDGRLAVVATSNGSLGSAHLFGIDVETGERTFETPAENIRQGLWSVEAIGFTKQDRHFRVATGDSELVTYDAKTGMQSKRVKIDWRTEAQKAIRKPRTAQLWRGDFDFNSSRLVTSSAEFLYVWDADSGEQLLKRKMPHAKGCFVCFDRTGNTIATSDLQYSGDFGKDFIWIRQAGNGNADVKIPLNDTRASVMEFSPDGEKLFTGLIRGRAVVWNISKSD